MSDLRTSLEQARLEFPAPDLPIERVLQRRDRNQRNRRIGAGVAAAVIAVLAFALAASVIDRSDSEVPAGPVGNGAVTVLDAGRLIAIGGDGSRRVLIDDPFVAEGCDAAIGCHLGRVYAWSPDGAQLAFEAGKMDETSSTWAIYLMRADGTDVRRVFECPGRSNIGTCIDLAWSPDGTRLVVGYDGALWVTDLGSGETRAIAGCSTCPDADGAPIFPTWSPDGARIAYQRIQRPTASTSGLAVANADGSGVEILLDPSGNEAGVEGPTWSPDGGTILYRTTTRDSGDHGELWTIDVETGEQTQLLGSMGTSTRNSSASYTPDGRTIVVSTISSEGCLSPGCPFSVSISTMDTDASGFRSIYESDCCTAPNTEDAFGEPSVSPDGTAITFSVIFDKSRAEDSGVYVMALDGSYLQHIARSGSAPAWQPVADTAARSDFSVTAIQVGTGQLAFRNNGGLSLTETFTTDPRGVIETPFVAEGCDLYLRCAVGDQIAWSADGATLAFEAGVTDDQNNAWGIYVVHDGAAPQWVGTCQGRLPLDGPCTELVVSPNGHRVAYSPDGNGSFQIVDTAIRSVAACGECTPGLVFDPSWSPDGNMIAFAGPSGSMGVMHADGSDVRILMPAPAGAGGSSPPTAAPMWSLDGKIWAIDDDGCSHAVRSIDPATGGSELLFGLPSGCGSRVVRVAPMPGDEVAYAELTTGRCGDPSCLGFNVYTSSHDRKDFTLTTVWCCGPIDPDSLSMLEDHVAFGVQPGDPAPRSVRVGRLVYRGADVPVWQPTTGTS